MSVPESVQGPRRRMRWLLVVVGLCLLLPLDAAEPPKGEMSAAVRQAKVKERNRLIEEGNKLLAAGKLAEAISVAEKELAIAREVFGDRTTAVVESVQWLAKLHEQQEDFTAAGNRLREVRDIQTARYGKDDWRVTDARLALADVELRAKLDGEQRMQLAEAKRLNRQVVALYRKGGSREAIPLAERALALRKQVLGDKHPDYAASLNNLAGLYDSMGDYAKAEPLYRQASDIHKQALGDKHPDYASSLNNLALLYDSMGDYAKAEPLYRQALAIDKEVLGEKHPGYATDLNNLALLYKSMGDYAKAEPLHRQASDIRKQALGDKHPDYASSLNNLAALYRAMGDYAKAEPLYRQARDIRKQALGEKHPVYVTSLNDLAKLYESMGDYAKAEPLYRQTRDIYRQALGEKHPGYTQSLKNLAALYYAMGAYSEAEPLYRQTRDIYKQMLGDKHPDYAEILNNLAVIYQSMGDYAKAEPLYRQAEDIYRQALGEKHPHYAMNLNNLAALYETMGDYVKAEPLYRQAGDILKQALGEKHPHYATSLNNLAMLYNSMGDCAKAEPLYRQASEILRQALGEKHPHYALSLQNLAALYVTMGDYAKAEPLYRQALSINKQVLGDKHPDYATSLNNLALLYFLMGDYAKAEPLCRQVLDIRKHALGEKHPSYARSVHNLAMLYQAMGDYTKAKPLYQQSLNITRQTLQLTAVVQSERQQLLMGDSLRVILDCYLSAVVQAQAKGKLAGDTTLPNVYGHVLAWKGAVFMQQRRQRLARSQPELKPLFAKWESVCSRLATRALAVPTPAQHDAWQRDLVQLTEEKEDLEVPLAQKSVAFRRQKQVQKRTLADVRKALPADAALIDFLEYWHFEPNAKKKGNWIIERRLIAFVVRPDRKLEMVQLGAVKPLAEAIDKWRQSYGQSGWRPNVEAAKLLRDKLWLPLERHLKGANTVLVSPDGVLGKLPLAALPGDKPDSYLIETWNLTIVPVPQLLPELLAAPDKADAVPPPSLLLVGDVDYGAAPGLANFVASRSAPAGGRGWNMHGWRRLPATSTEIEGIQASFQRAFPAAKSLPLPKGEATENAVRTAAPHYRYLHLATHGYFAPKELRSALSPAVKENNPLALGRDVLSRGGVVGHHPGLLSGVVLAGANRSAQEGEDDGILTATEVASLDLSCVETVVLSACETGLGEVAGGEGLLGLQRAFQESGAHTVVAGLWQVEDECTRRLMERFYDNVWRKKMGKLAALREAQCWMLRKASKDAGILRAATRGLYRPDDRPRPRPGDPLPPYYWAAFVLSGDWR